LQIADWGFEKAQGIEQGVRSQNPEEKQLKLSSSQLLATDYWLLDSLIANMGCEM
jgi:hypothetical protein